MHGLLCILSGSIAESTSDTTYCDVTARGLSVCTSACESVTLVHPAKAVGRNEMPFDREIYTVPSNTVLDRGPRSPMERGGFGVETPSSQRCRRSPNYVDPCWKSDISIILSSCIYFGNCYSNCLAVSARW